MDKQTATDLQKAIKAQTSKRKQMGFTTPPTVIKSALAKPPKCAPNSPNFSLSETPGADWPPAHLEPVVFSSNLARWEAFDWRRHPALIKAKPIIVDWYNGLPASGALVLAGNYGCGKTHIAEAIADLFGRWRTSVYEEVGLVEAIQDTYGDNRKSESDVWGPIFRSELLILDDLGTYKTKNMDWLANFYARIFNDFMTVQGKPVLITTNLELSFSTDPMVDPVGLEGRIGPRLASRLCDALGNMRQYVNLFAVSDYRIERFLR